MKGKITKRNKIKHINKHQRLRNIIRHVDKHQSIKKSRRNVIKHQTTRHIDCHMIRNVIKHQNVRHICENGRGKTMPRRKQKQDLQWDILRLKRKQRHRERVL